MPDNVIGYKAPEKRVTAEEVDILNMYTTAGTIIVPALESRKPISLGEPGVWGVPFRRGMNSIKRGVKVLFKLG